MADKGKLNYRKWEIMFSIINLNHEIEKLVNETRNKLEKLLN